MCDLSPRSRCRETIHRFKTNSPKLREALRKKCRERWRRDRQECLEKIRDHSRQIDLQDILSSIMREDLKDLYRNGSVREKSTLEEDLSRLSDIEKERQLETDWFLATYDDMLEDENGLALMFDSINEVICPVCRKSSMRKNSDRLSCDCGLDVRTDSDLFEVREKILELVEGHDRTCDEDARFSVIKELDGDHVYLVCYSCSNFSMLL